MSVGGPQNPISQLPQGEPIFNVAEMPTRGQKLARTEREILIDIADLLTRQTAVLEHIRASLTLASESGGEERIPSVAVEDMAKGPPKITSKSYDGRPLTRDLVDQHLDAHGYAHREAEARALNGWQDTVDAAVEQA